MTFDAFETSDGRPVETYDFTQGGVTTRVTNAAFQQTIGGNVYASLAALSRTEPLINEEINSGEITISVPHTFDIAAQFRFTLPSSLPSLTIFRAHLNDGGTPESIAVWKGEIVSCKFGDNFAKLIGQPITRIFDKQIPSRVFSATCNWQLYGRGCEVTRATYTKSTLLTSTDPTSQIITIATLRTLAETIDTDEGLGLNTTELDNFWNRGVIAITGSPGERRAIIETDIGSDPNVVRINRPFVLSALAGVAIDVSAGCNHLLSGDCSRKFLNTEQYGGFPTVPANNPFEIELDAGLSNSATAKRISRFF